MQFNNPPGEIKSMTTLYLTKSIGRSSSRLALLLIPLVFACFALSPMAQAVSPPPDGGYPGQNTAEGHNALFNLSPTDGGFNTAIGWVSLFSNTTGSLNTGVGAGTLWANTSHNNTAVGAGALALNTTGDGNTANGALALLQNTEGRGNTAVGGQALFSNTNGSGNTANGAFALLQNTIGRGNTAVGAGALAANDGDPSIENSGSGNTAVGAGVLSNNTTGSGSTGVGARALLNNTAEGNTAVGVDALTSNTTGIGNTATGAEALQLNTIGAGNTAVGARALQNNIGDNTFTLPRGALNTAVGALALQQNTEGSGNTAVGAGPGETEVGFIAAALGSNTTGKRNTAVGGTNGDGDAALGKNTEGDFNTAVGAGALSSNTTGANNIAVGDGAGDGLTTGNNNIDIGNHGVADEANTIRIGKIGTIDYFQDRTFIAGIHGITTANTAIPVVIDSDGQLGTMSSSKRFKKEIKPIDGASEAILGLKPVTFHYKSDTKDTPQFGLIAEEVAKVNPALVVRDKDGKIYTVRYDAVNAMLLNEFLKEHQKVEDLRKDFQATVSRQQKQIEALTSGLQKVSAQVEASGPAPQVVNNP